MLLEQVKDQSARVKSVVIALLEFHRYVNVRYDDDWGLRSRQLYWSTCANNYGIVTPQKKNKASRL